VTIGRVHGSANVFRDFGDPNAEVLQLKAILAAKIIDVLDAEKITVRRAHELTGFAAADFSRVRNAKLQRFTVDRLIEMLGKARAGRRRAGFRAPARGGTCAAARLTGSGSRIPVQGSQLEAVPCSSWR
jgi:predicted XRE-type DNA-binding protein